MAAVASEYVSIESTYVYFGTLKLRVVKPTVVHINHIVINVYDVNNAQRLSIQIASKHICKALLCHSGQHKAIAFLVNRFCAGKIRETLHIASVPEATIGKSAPYFDSESARVCQRYILVDITRCTKNDMDLLKQVLRLVEETKLLFKAQNIGQRVVINAPTGNFFGDMDENDFVTLMRDIGLSVRQVSGTLPNLESRLIDNNASNAASTDISSQPSQIFLHSQPHVYISNRCSLSAVHSQEITKPSDVQQLSGIAYHQSNPACVVQHRPITVNIVRVAQPRYVSSSGSSPGIHVSHRRSSVIAQPITSPRNTRTVVRPPTKKVSVLMHTGAQSRIIKQQLNVSELSLSATSNEPSTSRCGMPSEAKMSNQSCKRIVHVIDDDDDEGGPLKLTKGPNLDLLLNYPRDQPVISIHYADVEYLRPNEMLNDTVIEFYLKYIHMELVSSERRPSIFIFNSFFYSRLTQMPPAGSGVIRTISSRAKWIAENYKGVRTWTKNVDIFNADYIVVPIVEDIHWYLAIITFPRYSIVNRVPETTNHKENSVIPKSLRKTCIILLDSLADAADMKRKLTVPVLREYLVCEYEDKRKLKDGNTKYFAKELIEKIVPFPVPQQRNYTDCGLFLLKFAECFLLKPPSFITRNDSFRRWYPNFTIRGMRRTILTKLKSACDDEAWRAYEEYSRNRDINSQSVEDILSKQSACSRSPSPVPRRRTLSTGDCDVGWSGHFRRRRSLPARLSC
ncbi:Ulp1 protease [Loa loa]|uniref:Ulp1 protease n=1 Tax=Loa loa TaxID=7209 RepID=A0A1I7VKU2_LOALO|nr:Ulp1 protease [Loa loa]EFO27069.1 Ulp1 protease [Loa loa]